MTNRRQIVGRWRTVISAVSPPYRAEFGSSHRIPASLGLISQPVYNQETQSILDQIHHQIKIHMLLDHILQVIHHLMHLWLA